jgi:threonine synthase
MKTNQFQYKPANTIADSISAGAPRNLFMAASAVNDSDGKVMVVSDIEILSAQKELAEKYGQLVEPAAAASYAGFLKSEEKNKSVMLMLTGSGLKDLASLKKWNTTHNI